MFSWQYKAGCVALWQKACLAYKRSQHQAPEPQREFLQWTEYKQIDRKSLQASFTHKNSQQLLKSSLAVHLLDSLSLPLSHTHSLILPKPAAALSQRAISPLDATKASFLPPSVSCHSFLHKPTRASCRRPWHTTVQQQKPNSLKMTPDGDW